MTDAERKSGEEEVYLFSGMEIVVVFFCCFSVIFETRSYLIVGGGIIAQVEEIKPLVYCP